MLNTSPGARAARPKQRYGYYEEEEQSAAEEALRKSYAPAKAESESAPGATQSGKRPTSNNNSAWAGSEKAQRAPTAAVSSAVKGATAGAAIAAAQKGQSYASQRRNPAKGAQSAAATGYAAQLAAQGRQMAQNALKLKEELKRKKEKEALEKTAGSQAMVNAAVAAAQSAAGKLSGAEAASAAQKAKEYQKGVISRPQEPAGFVPAFENFMFDKDPFCLIKPDGMSDLSPEQQEEAAAIFNNVFDGESYQKYKEKQAAEKIGRQLLESGAVGGAAAIGDKAKGDNEKAKLPSISEIDKDFREKVREAFIKPQSAREEIDEQRREQLDRRRGEKEESVVELKSELPMAERKADELDTKSYEERFRELINPKYISVVGMPETYGGSQMWFNKFYQKYGCGVIAMNDVLMYLDRSTGKQSSKSIEVNVEDYMWSFIRSANSVNVHGPLAALGTDIAASMDIYFAINDMPYFATSSLKSIALSILEERF